MSKSPLDRAVEEADRRVAATTAEFRHAGGRGSAGSEDSFRPAFAGLPLSYDEAVKYAMAQSAVVMGYEFDADIPPAEIEKTIDQLIAGAVLRGVALGMIAASEGPWR